MGSCGPGISGFSDDKVIIIIIIIITTTQSSPGFILE